MRLKRCQCSMIAGSLSRHLASRPRQQYKPDHRQAAGASAMGHFRRTAAKRVTLVGMGKDGLLGQPRFPKALDEQLRV
jgi:hypothetical protein